MATYLVQNHSGYPALLPLTTDELKLAMASLVHRSFIRIKVGESIILRIEENEPVPDSNQ